MGGFIDDGFHAHPKREIGGCPADGLLARAISYAGDNKTDGWVPASWAEKQFPRRWRQMVLGTALEARLLECFPAGAVREYHGPKKQGLRTKPVTVTVGPHTVDGYVVRDYLHWNRAECERQAKRQAERTKKRGQRSKARLWNGDVPRDTHGESPLRGDSGVGAGGGRRTETMTEDQHELVARVDAVLALLYDVDRFAANANQVEDPVRVANFISRFPSADPLEAAADAADWGRSSTWEIDDGVTSFAVAMRKQVERAAEKQAASGEPSVRERGHQALKTLLGEAG